jgi:hypothetical protein
MSDASGSGFGKFVPGFEFLQNLAGQAAGGVAQGIGNSIPQMPNLGNWVAPTFNVEDLEKRIEELKAVHFWLDQNSKALGATIQALEVQKMTLATLKGMNFSLGDVANALKIKAADAVAGFTGAAAAPAPTQFAGLEIPARTYGKPAAPEPEEEDSDDGHEPEAEAQPAPSSRKSPARKAAAPAPASGVVDPMQWWGALSQQFQNIAASAMKDVAKQTALDTTRQVATGLTEQAVKTATGMAGKAAGSVARNVGNAVGMGKAAARAVTSPRAPARKPAAAPAAKKATAKKAAPRRAAAPAPRAAAVQPLSPGDWTLPTAFFPGFQPVAAPAPRAAGKAVTRKAPAKKATAKKAAAPVARGRRR